MFSFKPRPGRRQREAAAISFLVVVCCLLLLLRLWFPVVFRTRQRLQPAILCVSDSRVASIAPESASEMEQIVVSCVPSWISHERTRNFLPAAIAKRRRQIIKIVNLWRAECTFTVALDSSCNRVPPIVYFIYFATFLSPRAPPWRTFLITRWLSLWNFTHFFTPLIYRSRITLSRRVNALFTPRTDSVRLSSLDCSSRHHTRPQSRNGSNSTVDYSAHVG